MFLQYSTTTWTVWEKVRGRSKPMDTYNTNDFFSFFLETILFHVTILKECCWNLKNTNPLHGPGTICHTPRPPHPTQAHTDTHVYAKWKTEIFRISLDSEQRKYQENQSEPSRLMKISNTYGVHIKATLFVFANHDKFAVNNVGPTLWELTYALFMNSE